MSERGGNPWGGIVFALALALGGGLMLAIYLIGGDALRTMGLILISGLTLALVIAASALPIRAWRRRDFTGDHYHHDGTKTVVRETRIIDGRAPAPANIKLLQLPAQPQAGAYPELLRAAYQAGATTLPARNTAGPWQSEPGAYTEAEIGELDLVDARAGWDGDIIA